MYKQSFRFSLSALVCAGLLSACAPFSIKPPSGFVEVQDYSRHTRMKAHDHVGLSVRTFANMRGGTQAFWAEDLVKKLGMRGYTLVGQRAVKSKNGKVGTRLDFNYVPPGTDEQKFYIAVLFVTDEYRTVVQLAGDAEHSATYQARVDEVLGSLKVRGCRLGSKICGGSQPPPLQTSPPAPAPAQEAQPPSGGQPVQPVQPTTAPVNQPA